MAALISESGQATNNNNGNNMTTFHQKQSPPASALHNESICHQILWASFDSAGTRRLGCAQGRRDYAPDSRRTPDDGRPKPRRSGKTEGKLVGAWVPPEARLMATTGGGRPIWARMGAPDGRTATPTRLSRWDAPICRCFSKAGQPSRDDDDDLPAAHRDHINHAPRYWWRISDT